MQGAVSAGNLLPGTSFTVLDLQGSLGIPQNPNSMAHHQLQDVYPLSIGQHLGNSFSSERGKNSMSDEEERSLTEDGIENHQDGTPGKKNSPWQRMKWTDEMVRLLITVVSCIGEDSSPEFGKMGRRKSTVLQKKGKWKWVSKIMAKKRCYVSPQQCEDKFNDLNKRYKRLTDVLGRGTSCKVVEHPALLDLMDHLSEKTKEDVRKILSSKHLFYEEMCSYHNGNRLHLPLDPSLQQCVQSVLKGRDADDTRRHAHDDTGEDDHDDDDVDERDDELDDHNTNNNNANNSSSFHGDDGGFIGVSCFPKRMKLRQDTEEVNFANSLNPQELNNRLGSEAFASEMNQIMQDGTKAAWAQRQWIRNRTLQLEEQSLSIQAQMLELEKQRFKWQKFSRKKDRELSKMRMENERMKLANERLTLELKRKELENELI
ncbi:probable WRKY transcription factor protein 1 [Amborella trichopoda]|uniref:Myb/SANT-like DNA-binding domain-containing protein n=1 Tax=Amborella trichopoda TaxID=13333 RepID=U5D6R4_AMBTC|nr:probable WRKY transcription factor protein 1 [Amborella trichopoda]ERN16023.1 hypothetical protein AMTR_s00030p00089780 [Amborella trichopoda]|eukprot:XP_006854556.1 probable WRKY transcription factor protein 1 [Amborella trichopoda]